jgi:hypothetical protein
MIPTANQVKDAEDTKVDNLDLHRRMYERRLRLLKECGGLTEGEATDRANDPSLLTQTKPKKQTTNNLLFCNYPGRFSY